MQALSPQLYARLGHLAAAYQRRHAGELKPNAHGNPRLSVDALCFQHHGDGLIGALITPRALLLVRIAGQAGQDEATDDERRVFDLPSGRYPFVAERLEEEVLWRCELIDDLSGLAGPEGASQLAQRMMDRVMTPGVDNANAGA